MKELTIYHGSTNIVDKPRFLLGKKYNDYGQGFYCTFDIEMAKEWACKENNNGFVNEYKINLSDLKILDLTDKKYNILNWIAILLKNRKFELQEQISRQAKEYLLENFLIDTNEYDLIIGYRADDSYFSFAQSFVANSLSVRQLEKSFKLGQLGLQIALISEKAFKNIVYINSFYVSKDIYYSKYIHRDKSARSYFFNIIKSEEFNENDIFVLDIMRKKMKNI